MSASPLGKSIPKMVRLCHIPQFLSVWGCGGGMCHSRCAFDGVATKSDKDSPSEMVGFSFTWGQQMV
jgi:hypothetical protein